MSETIKQKGTSKKETVSRIHAASKAEFPENLHPESSFFFPENSVLVT